MISARSYKKQLYDLKNKRWNFYKFQEVFEQEKLRLQDEIKTYMTRDEEHLRKQTSLYDEIQQVNIFVL